MKNKKTHTRNIAGLITIVISCLINSNPKAHALVEPYIEYVSNVDNVRIFSLAGLHSAWEHVPTHEPSPSNPLFTKAQDFVKKAVGASFDYDGLCSATFISDQGHALTASHCLTGLMSTPNDINFDDRTRTHPLQVRSVVQFGTHEEDKTYQDLQLIAWGSYIPHKKMYELDLDTDPSIVEKNNDWAIVKFKNLPSTHSCITHSVDLPEPGERIWSSGFPVHAKPNKYLITNEHLRRDRYLHRMSGLSGDLYQQLEEVIIESDRKFHDILSTENVNNDPFFRMEQDRSHNVHVVSLGRFYHDYNQAYESVRYPFYGVPQPQIESFFEYPKYAMSTLHASQGMSGGGVYNTDSDLIGVVVTTTGGPVFGDIYNIGMRFVTLSHIKAAILKDHTYIESDVDEMFNCSVRSLQ